MFAGPAEEFSCSRSHVDIALESKELEICPYSWLAYYLFGRLAQLELDLCQEVYRHLLDAGLDMMACPGNTFFNLHNPQTPSLTKRGGEDREQVGHLPRA